MAHVGQKGRFCVAGGLSGPQGRLGNLFGMAGMAIAILTTVIFFRPSGFSGWLLVVLGLGGNDMLRGIKPEETKANMSAIMDELKRRDIPVVLTGMLAAPNLGADYVNSFNGIFPDLANTYGASLYPFFLDGVVTDAALMLPDNIHPNAKGVSRVVEGLSPLIEAALKRQDEAVLEK